jgi:hypothetical protein
MTPTTTPTVDAEVSAVLPAPKRARITDLSPTLLVPETARQPKSVREAAAKARAAWATYEEAAAAFTEAEQDVAQAPALDAANAILPAV